MKLIYTVWMQDMSLSPDDPDHEWPACFVIEAEDEVSAREWGDRLAHRRAAATRQRVLSSSTEPLEKTTLPGVEKLPTVVAGQEVTDEHIGW